MRILPSIKKSQSATEYLIILAILLFLLVLLFGVGWEMLTTSTMKIRMIKARDLIDSLANAAATVYEEGQGAKTTVYVHVPEGISGYRTSGTLLYLNISLGGEIRPYSYPLDFPIHLTLTTTAGDYWANVTSEGNVVNIIVQ